MSNLLSWDKPKRVMSKEKRANNFSADGAPPGTYVPNMSEADKAKWKAKLVGVRGDGPLQVEIRKTTANGTQMLVKVSLGGFRADNPWQRKNYGPLVPRSEKMNVHVSCNGPAFFTFADFQELQRVVDEAKARLEQAEKRDARPEPGAE